VKWKRKMYLNAYEVKCIGDRERETDWLISLFPDKVSDWSPLPLSSPPKGDVSKLFVFLPSFLFDQCGVQTGSWFTRQSGMLCGYLSNTDIPQHECSFFTWSRMEQHSS
jgi:hypothetical protein